MQACEIGSNLSERFEYHVELVRRNAYTRVAHPNECVRARRGARDLDLATVTGELQGIRKQVDDDLTKLLLIGTHREAQRAVGDREGESFRPGLRRDERLCHGECLSQPHIHDVVVHRAGLELRIVEHLVDESEEMPLAGLDASQVVALLVRDGTTNAHLEQLGIPADRVERRAQLVAHHGEEFAFRTVRRLRLPSRGFGIGARALGLGEDLLGFGQQSFYISPRQHLLGDIRPMGHDA